jgi:F-type H+-transporting ATPase subunit b
MIQSKQPIIILGLHISLLCALPSLGWAAEDTHAEHAGSSQWLTLLFFTINFLIFVFVLRKFALGIIKQKLKERHASVVQALDEAKRAKEEAEQLRQEYEQKIANLAAEEEQFRTQAIEAAERERTRIMEEARQMAERATAEVQLIAQREIEAARQLLRKEVARQAVQIATALIQENVTSSDNNRLIQNLVREVGNAGNAGS